jgi:hypothetical protein
VTKRLDPARDDAGVRLPTAWRRRGMTQTALADLACLSPSFVSMVETGQQELTRVCDIVALADALKVSPLYLADRREDPPRQDRTCPNGAFPGALSPHHAGPAPAARHAPAHPQVITQEMSHHHDPHAQSHPLT